MKRILLLLLPVTLLAAPPQNHGYGRLTTTNTVEYAPATLNLGNVVNGRVYPHPVKALHPSAAQYAEQGWLPVVTNPPARPGLVPVRIVRWEQTDGTIRAVWSWKEAPPRNLQLSKMRLKTYLREAGAWDGVWAMISADPSRLADWNDSVVLDERDPSVQTMFSAIIAAGLVTSNEMEEIVVSSVTEIEVRQ